VLSINNSSPELKYLSDTVLKTVYAKKELIKIRKRMEIFKIRFFDEFSFFIPFEILFAPLFKKYFNFYFTSNGDSDR
jgi:hypothetical protein